MWEFRGDQLFATPPLVEDQDDPNLMVPLCEKVLVTNKTVDLLSGNETVDIILYKPYGPKLVTLDRDKLVEGRFLGPLVRQGLTIMDGPESVSILKSVLLDTENDAPVTFHHDRLGFMDIQGSPCFLGHLPIGNLPEPQKSSTYTRSEATRPAGSLGVWRRFLITEAAKRPELGLILALSVTAPVAHILKREAIFTEVPLWALVGDSSSGKSTVLHLAGSIWGNPSKLTSSFHATSSAFFALLTAQAGIPFLADEASHVPSFDFDDLIYSLPTGREKRRCKSDGGLKPPVEFSGAIIITSEISILERTRNNSGQKARLVEFNFGWTDSPEQADRIRAVCAKNYGLGVEPIISLLLGGGFTKKLVRKFLYYKASLTQEFDRNLTGVDHRLIQRLALILTATWVFQKALKVDLHLTEIRSLLSAVFLDTAESFSPVDAVDELHNFIASEITLHQSQYPPEADLSKKRSAYRSQNLHGVHGFWGNTPCVWVVADIFRNILDRYGKYSRKSACRKLEQKGYLVRFNDDRFVKKTHLGVSPPECYCVLFPELPSVAQEIASLPSGKRNQMAAAKALTGDPLGLCSDFSSSKNIMNHFSVATRRMAVGFLYLSTQCLRLTINKELATALNLSQSTPLYIVTIPEAGILMLSREKLLTNASKVSLHASKVKAYLWTEVQLVRAIAVNMNLSLKIYEREVFFDVAIEQREHPVAIVNIRNTADTWVGSLNDLDPSDINDLTCGCHSASCDETLKRRTHLLTEDDED